MPLIVESEQIILRILENYFLRPPAQVCNNDLVLGNLSAYDVRMSSQVSASDAPRVFPNTRWSVVLAATQQPSPESAAALEALCRAYWYPLYAYVRRCGQSPHDAQDLTQEFFRRLLEKRWLDAADRERGKLRMFLIGGAETFHEQRMAPGFCATARWRPDPRPVRHFPGRKPLRRRPIRPARGG